MQVAASTSELASLVTKGAFKADKSDNAMAGWMSLPKIKMGGCCGSAKVSGRATSQHKFSYAATSLARSYLNLNAPQRRAAVRANPVSQDCNTLFSIAHSTLSYFLTPT
jgi:hypothetical protein